ncbi:T9SS type A sorting domain-containing protein [Cryomorphaceae bacterium 1068]|nr:T9SS type A sorting domain-containing protein [Cryomorphaceae bacterium 1068]
MKSLKTIIKGAALAGALLSFLATSAQEASFTFFPASVEVYEGESFETQVLIETGNVPFTVFDLHLAFDTEYLQVMDIEIAESNAFNYHSPAEFTNEAGRIDAAAFKTTPETSVESMLVATITFVALTQTDLTEVEHIEEAFPRSIIAYGGESVTGELGKLAVSINGNALSTGDTPETNPFNLSIWPNPSSDVSKISFELFEEEQISLQVFTLEGKLVETIFEGSAQSKTPYQFEIDVNHLAAGNYSCRLSTSSGKVSSKSLTVVQ